MISLGFGPPRPLVFPPGLDYEEGALFWWTQREIRYRRRIGYQYTPIHRYGDQLRAGLFTCDNLHPNLGKDEQCPYCGTEPEYWIADFEDEVTLANYLHDSWHTVGPHCWKVPSWKKVVEMVLACPPGSYRELINHTHAEMRARYGAEDFPPEDDDPEEEGQRVGRKRLWAQQHAEWNRQEADEMWAEYDRWEEEQRAKREHANPSLPT